MKLINLSLTEKGIKNKYYLTLYLLSLWPLVISMSIVLVIFDFYNASIIFLCIGLIHAGLDEFFTHRWSYPDGKIKEFLYKNLKMNEWEKACKEFLKGCTCAELDHQEDCDNCLKAFCSHLRDLAKKENYSEINKYCLKIKK
jgi:hypothetical protein